MANVDIRRLRDRQPWWGWPLALGLFALLVWLLAELWMAGRTNRWSREPCPPPG